MTDIKPKVSIAESLFFNLLLSFSGGFQDAYTYLIRDEVFANAQTGNIILVSTSFLEGDWQKALRYLAPIIAFIGGILFVETMRFHNEKFRKINWMQLVLIFQSAIMISVGFMPQNLNSLATVLVSFSCAMQVQSFRKFGDNLYASTMCIGNLRSGAVSLSTYFQTKDRKYALKCIHYFSIIIIFAIGACFCAGIISLFAEKTIWVCAVMLMLCFVILKVDEKKH